MIFTDDPLRDYERHEREQERELEDCVHCDECGEPIQDDYAYRFGEEVYCDDCVWNHRFRVN